MQDVSIEMVKINEMCEVTSVKRGMGWTEGLIIY